MENSRPIIVHTIEHAKTALQAADMLGIGIALQSPPGALAYAGGLYLLAMFAEAQAAYPNAHAIFILDCAEGGAVAVEAMRTGHRHIRCADAKIRDIAGQSGVCVHDGAYEALDLLLARDTKSACEKWLQETI